MSISVRFTTSAVQFNTTTRFNLTSTLAPDSDGVIVQTLTAASGILDRASMNTLVGPNGYFIRSVLFSSTVSSQMGLGALQPNALTSNSLRSFQWISWVNGTGGNPTPANMYPRLEPYYVPPGWELAFYANVNGTNSITIEFDTYTDETECAQTMATCEFWYPQLQA